MKDSTSAGRPRARFRSGSFWSSTTSASLHANATMSKFRFVAGLLLMVAVPVRIVLVLDDQRVLARQRDHEQEAGYKPKLGHRLLLHRKGGTSSPPCDHQHGGENRLRTSNSNQP